MSTGIEERERRIAKNETVFREVNERLKAVNEVFSSFSGTMEIVCECGDIACTLQLTIAPSEYEHIRSNARYFAVIPGHDSADVERVVASRDGYDIVLKGAGVPAAVSRATDPRA